MRARRIESRVRPKGPGRETVFQLGGDDLPRWNAVGKNADVRSLTTRVANLPTSGQVRMSAVSTTGFLALIPPTSASGVLAGTHDTTQLITGHQTFLFASCRFNAAGAAEVTGVGIHYPWKMTNVPSSISTFAAGGTVDVNVSATTVNAITIDGCRFDLTATAGGDCQASRVLGTNGN